MEKISGTREETFFNSQHSSRNLKKYFARKLIFYKTAQNDKTDKLFVSVCRHIVQLELFSKTKIAIL